MTPALKIHLAERKWPGQVEQLYTALNELLALIGDERITLKTMKEIEDIKKNTSIPSTFQRFLRENPSQRQPMLFEDLPSNGYIEPTIAELENEYIRHVMRRHNRNYSKVARILGITRKTLYEKVRRYSLLDETPTTKAHA